MVLREPEREISLRDRSWFAGFLPAEKNSNYLFDKI